MLESTTARTMTDICVLQRIASDADSQFGGNIRHDIEKLKDLAPERGCQRLSGQLVEMVDSEADIESTGTLLDEKYEGLDGAIEGGS